MIRYKCRMRLLICFLLLLIGTFSTIGLCILRFRELIYEYAVVIDAGSMHTAVYVNRWDGENFRNIRSKREERGISDFKDNLKGLRPFLQRLFDYANTQIPKNMLVLPPMYFGATGGMRILRAKNNTICEEIMKIVKSTIQEYRFDFSNEFKQARILSGGEEGLYSWVSSNYVAGVLQTKTTANSTLQLILNPGNAKGNDTIGALDLGGSSMQITFYPGSSLKIPLKYIQNVKLNGPKFVVYSYSYRCYGVIEALRMYKSLLVKSQNYSLHITNPCGPTGYTENNSYADIFESPCTEESFDKRRHDILKNKNFTFEGRSNSKQCKAMLQKLFDFSHCDYSHCGFNGQYQPNVHGKYYAITNFYFAIEFLRDNLDLKLIEFKTSLSNFTGSVNTLCGKNWTEVQRMKTNFKTLLPWYCFGGQYIYTLMILGYKFNTSTWNDISFVNKINDTEIGWSLGYMLESRVNAPVKSPVFNSSLAKLIGLILMYVGSMVLCFVLGCLVIRYACTDERGKYHPLPRYGSTGTNLSRYNNDSDSET